MRVLIVPNAGNSVALASAREVVASLAAGGFDPVLTSDDAEASGLKDFGVPVTEIGEPGLVVSLGGDGTILKAVHLLGPIEVPILGVNMGKLGFLTGAPSEGLHDAVASALAGEGQIERRETLEAIVVMGGREVGRYRALNEVFVGRGASGRVIEVSLSVSGTPMMSFTGDGVIVATPTGSTAYALSAGGPIVSPSVPCNVVVPVAPHTLTTRSMVIGSSDVVEIRLPDPARRDGCVSVDGELTPCRRDIESVTVCRSESDVLLVKLDGRDFYEVAAAEFLGG
ncbi:MAG: NAD(+)/NADH kinase [Actinomycetota bacterium]|nr:NAD(+)/NADH kinase [Actinomycetota bacterium]